MIWQWLLLGGVFAGSTFTAAAEGSPAEEGVCRPGAGCPISPADGKKVKRILVTGGAGFLGSHLVDRLLEAGHHVIVADNYFTGDKFNLKRWLGNPALEIIRHDITQELFVEVDQIYHLACPASPPHYKYNPIKTMKTSILGTMNMLGLALRVRARMLFTSTSEVYGDPLEHPQTEEYWGNVNPIGVRACYDEGKRAAETLMFDYHRTHNLEIRVARIFNTYGPRMNLGDGRVVSNFVAQALQGVPLTIYKPGTQTRSFCFVSDLVDGLIRLMEGNSTGPINLGNPDEFTMEELALAVKEVVNPNATVIYKDNTADDPRQRKPNITKAKTLLDWAPTVKLKDGLRMMKEDFAERLGLSLPTDGDTVADHGRPQWRMTQGGR
uniref:NAD-dependent epimerase/dehydratase domain-containing protein n=1 Tax=Alexandrium monilatum TaxID=311494 RepID=A0A6T0WLP1_9DINO